MATEVVETVATIGDLDPAKPGGAAAKSDGDNHIRNVKAALRQSFAGFTGAVLVTGVDGGAANAYTLTPATPVAAYGTKMKVLFTPIATNTDPACTLNISGLGAKSIKSVSGAALLPGELVAGTTYEATYNGTEVRLTAITKKYADTLAVSGIVPGINDPANAGKALVGGGSFVSLDGRGEKSTIKGTFGTSGSTTPFVISFNDGDLTFTAAGILNISAADFPAGRSTSILVRAFGLGAYPPVTSGITWIKSDKNTTPVFGSSGITFPATGPGFFTLFSLGDGTVYGMA